jgi:hypothetical protein
MAVEALTKPLFEIRPGAGFVDSEYRARRTRNPASRRSRSAAVMFVKPPIWTARTTLCKGRRLAATPGLRSGGLFTGGRINLLAVMLHHSGEREKGGGEPWRRIAFASSHQRMESFSSRIPTGN